MKKQIDPEKLAQWQADVRKLIGTNTPKSLLAAWKKLWVRTVFPPDAIRAELVHELFKAVGLSYESNELGYNVRMSRFPLTMTKARDFAYRVPFKKGGKAKRSASTDLLDSVISDTGMETYLLALHFERFIPRRRVPRVWSVGRLGGQTII